MLFICFSHLLFLNWLIKSDKKIISQIFMTIFTDKQKANFNSMRWQDAFSWFPIEPLSTELQWSNYLKYSELKGWLTFFWAWLCLWSAVKHVFECQMPKSNLHPWVGMFGKCIWRPFMHFCWIILVLGNVSFLCKSGLLQIAFYSQKSLLLILRQDICFHFLVVIINNVISRHNAL